ncbi:MAG: hypothetical protein WC242_01195 [Candidatus Paceibacterota bacterium]|jgi:hypothetical protein
MKSLLHFLIASLIGTTIVVNGATLHIEDILKETKSMANQANIHQISTALELYYSNNGFYPEANNGESLINLLKTEEYISGDPYNNSIFSYHSLNNGQDYKLKLGD